MAEEAADELQQLEDQRPIRTAPLTIVRLVMIVSWGAALAPAWIMVVSPNMRWRLAAMLVSVLILAPTLVLGFRQLKAESQATAAISKDESQDSFITVEDGAEDEASGQYFDQPTGLASKRYLTMFLHRELNRSSRANTPLSLAIFDIHDFRQLVEDGGIAEALTGLADIGARLRSALREYDLVARYAGGRLAVVLPETSERHASEIIERLHTLATSVCMNGKAVSATVGLASFPEHGTTAEELINSAHRALNRGKFSAANKVHTFSEAKRAS